MCLKAARTPLWLSCLPAAGHISGELRLLPGGRPVSRPAGVKDVCASLLQYFARRESEIVGWSKTVTCARSASHRLHFQLWPAITFPTSQPPPPHPFSSTFSSTSWLLSIFFFFFRYSCLNHSDHMPQPLQYFYSNWLGTGGFVVPTLLRTKFSGPIQTDPRPRTTDMDLFPGGGGKVAEAWCWPPPLLLPPGSSTGRTIPLPPLNACLECS